MYFDKLWNTGGVDGRPHILLPVESIDEPVEDTDIDTASSQWGQERLSGGVSDLRKYRNRSPSPVV